jgi:hypothetical protein
LAGFQETLVCEKAMPNISDTAYPRLKATPSNKELEKIFTPTPEEWRFAWERTSSELQTLRLLIWLKVFQRLGYFPAQDEIPAKIIEHIADSISTVQSSDVLANYDQNSLKWVHHSIVREYLGVSAYGESARKAAMEASLEASTTRDDLVDIVNVAIEELIRHRYELPAFSSLVRIARSARSRINSEYHQLVNQRLTGNTRKGLAALTDRSGKNAKTAWDSLKREPNRPTVRHVQDFIKHLQGLLEHDLRSEAFTGIPDIKVSQFAAEARSLDAASMRDFSESKRLTLAAALVLVQVGRAFDDVTDMFIRLVQRMHSRAREALDQHRLAKIAETDALVATLQQVSVAYKMEGCDTSRLNAIGKLLAGKSTQSLTGVKSMLCSLATITCRCCQSSTKARGLSL